MAAFRKVLFLAFGRMARVKRATGSRRVTYACVWIIYTRTHYIYVKNCSFVGHYNILCVFNQQIQGEQNLHVFGIKTGEHYSYIRMQDIVDLATNDTRSSMLTHQPNLFSLLVYDLH